MGRKGRAHESDSSQQAWEPVVIRRRSTKKKKTGTLPGSANGPKRDLYGDNATFRTQTTSSDYRKCLMDARLAKGWKQKELATRLNVQVAEVQKWESGKGVPPGNLRGKLNRVLQCKLPAIKKVKNSGD